MRTLSIRTQIALLLGLAVGGQALVAAACAVGLVRQNELERFAGLVSDANDATTAAAVIARHYVDDRAVSDPYAALIRSVLRRPTHECISRLNTMRAHRLWQDLAERERLGSEFDGLVAAFARVESLATGPGQDPNSSFVAMGSRLQRLAAAVSDLDAATRRTVVSARSMSHWFAGSLLVVYLAALFCLHRRATSLIVRPIRSLADAAERAMDRREPFALAPRGPTEVQTVGSVIKSFVGALESAVNHRTTELQSANTNLRLLNATLQREMQLRRSVEGQLRFEAHHDALTRLPNRHLLMERIDLLVDRSMRDSGFMFAVLFLDIDNFKTINDSLGHRAGDALLMEIARRLTACLRSLDGVFRPNSATTARLGGDEFVVLLDSLHREEDAILAARRIQEQLSHPVDLDGHVITISGSIGIAVNHGNRLDGHELLRDADTAMYWAKRAGKMQYAVFDRTMHLAASRRLKLESHLRFALQRNELDLVFQPIVGLERRVVSGFEALIRWRHPDEGVILPADFIPIAEETGLIVPIGEWVLRRACRQMRDWNESRSATARVSMSVNVSVRQLLAPEFREQLESIVRESAVERGLVNLEVTESFATEGSDEVAQILTDVRDLGVCVHMDDFGTGHSSLSCLQSLPLDAIKIDQSFVRRIAGDHRPAGILAGVMAMARNLNMKVIAEGIEDETQQGALLTLNCEYGQGYYYSRPVDPRTATELLAASKGDWRSWRQHALKRRERLCLPQPGAVA
jgi:diguanylate cyclase (GGDEF)-like protein